jgi:hypothetical protein
MEYGSTQVSQRQDLFGFYSAIGTPANGNVIIYNNGQWTYGSNAGNPFNQNLNTTDAVNFIDVSLPLSGEFKIDGKKVLSSPSANILQLGDANTTGVFSFGQVGSRKDNNLDINMVIVGATPLIYASIIGLAYTDITLGYPSATVQNVLINSNAAYKVGTDEKLNATRLNARNNFPQVSGELATVSAIPIPVNFTFNTANPAYTTITQAVYVSREITHIKLVVDARLNTATYLFTCQLYKDGTSISSPTQNIVAGGIQEVIFNVTPTTTLLTAAFYSLNIFTAAIAGADVIIGISAFIY